MNFAVGDGVDDLEVYQFNADRTCSNKVELNQDLFDYLETKKSKIEQRRVRLEEQLRVEQFKEGEGGDFYHQNF